MPKVLMVSFYHYHIITIWTILFSNTSTNPLYINTAYRLNTVQSLKMLQKPIKMNFLTQCYRSRHYNFKASFVSISGKEASPISDNILQSDLNLLCLQKRLYLGFSLVRVNTSQSFLPFLQYVATFNYYTHIL